jgi:hypothetical protein
MRRVGSHSFTEIYYAGCNELCREQATPEEASAQQNFADWVGLLATY